MTDVDAFRAAIRTAYTLLPDKMESKEADVMLAAIGLQESRLHYRRQVHGPARGLWQFELAGVRGVLAHKASRIPVMRLCMSLHVPAEAEEIHEQLEFDDTLAAGVARLLLWTDPFELPDLGEVDSAWSYYVRNWRPGAVKRNPIALREKFGRNYETALEICA